MDNTIEIRTKDPESTWVALDFSNNVIAEGKNPSLVTLDADRLGTDFILMWVGESDVTYIF